MRIKHIEHIMNKLIMLWPDSHHFDCKFLHYTFNFIILYCYFLHGTKTQPFSKVDFFIPLFIFTKRVTDCCFSSNADLSSLLEIAFSVIILKYVIQSCTMPDQFPFNMTPVQFSVTADVRPISFADL